MAVAVPDSWLGEILLRIEREPSMQLVRATHEEEALAIACGARLGGVRTAMFVQNAGLLSMGAGMVCLAQRYQFPLLMLVSYRGTPNDPVFYHIPKGRATEPVLTGLGVAHARAEPTRPIGPQVEAAATYAEEGSRPFALLLAREDIQW
jgi:sulfopyruvate decarboxylase subunit alpha